MPAEQTEEYITITGTAEEVVYKNPENGYIVITMDIDGAPETVVGTLGDIVEGESLILRGNYTANAKYGRQFKAVTCERKLPTTAAEIRRYLGSGVIKGIGPAMAKKITAAFGEESLDIIENDPKRLSTLNGISVDKALYIGTEFRKLNGIRSIIEFLQKYEISPLTASLVWKEFEGYLTSKGKLKLFRSEAIRVGFARLWKDKNYQAIVDIAERLPEQTVQEDPNILMYYDISLSRI